MSSLIDDRDKRPSSHQPPQKRICTSLKAPSLSKTSSNTNSRNPRDIQYILNLPEDAVWSLRKQDLRSCFLTLQQYALNPYPLPTLSIPRTTTTTTTTPISTPPTLPPFLRLPLEIRRQIYTLSLPRPVHPPVLGPHPRQLQSPLHLSQPIAPSLLLLNTQIRHEALPILFGGSTQTVHIQIDYNLWTHKSTRSSLILSSDLVSSIRNIDLSIHLGSERQSKNNRGKVAEKEAAARVLEVKKGIKKLGKWLAGAEVERLRVSWQEPSQVFGWEVKREILEGLKCVRARRVVVGSVNWGLGGEWNRGRRFRFEVGYLRELERGWDGDSVV